MGLISTAPATPQQEVVLQPATSDKHSKLLIIDSTEKCFSTDILTRPKVREFSTLNLFINLMIFCQLAKLTRAKRSFEELHLTNIDGEANSGAVKTVW